MRGYCLVVRAPRFRNLPVLLALCCAAALLLSFPPGARAWGRNGTKLVLNKAIETLPEDSRELRDFFESSRSYLLLHVTDPLDNLNITPAERHNHYIFLDKYGR